jgi:hypothetical protein
MKREVMIMEFFAVNGKRPVRLGDATRQFAYESLNHKYGHDTWKCDGVSMDDVENFQSLSDMEKYDLAIRRIAETAPIRICQGEKISGAATLGISITHNVPATLGGATVFGSVSHLTIDFETVLKYGVDHIYEKAKDACEKHKCTDDKTHNTKCHKNGVYNALFENLYLPDLHKGFSLSRSPEKICKGGKRQDKQNGL